MPFSLPSFPPIEYINLTKPGAHQGGPLLTCYNCFMANKFIAWLSVFAWMGLIFYLSDQPRVVPEIDPLLSLLISSLGHIVFYAVLYFLTRNAIGTSFRMKSQFVTLLSLSIVLLYGISDEYHQSFVPGRDASILDIGLDLLGGIIAAKLKL